MLTKTVNATTYLDSLDGKSKINNVKFNNDMKRLLRQVTSSFELLETKYKETNIEIKKLNDLAEINKILVKQVYKLNLELELKGNNMKRFTNLGKEVIDPDTHKRLSSSILFSEIY
jgi:hypothetical protein